MKGKRIVSGWLVFDVIAMQRIVTIVIETLSSNLVLVILFSLEHQWFKILYGVFFFAIDNHWLEDEP